VNRQNEREQSKGLFANDRSKQSFAYLGNGSRIEKTVKVISFRGLEALQGSEEKLLTGVFV
jgi:hypothetical protein